jgi:putative phosphoesterase
MKLALLGDVHGNFRALKAVLSRARLLNVNALLITGDLVGYYDAPSIVMEMLNAWECYIVRGNHEDMLKIARTDGEFLINVDAKYGRGLRSALEQLSDSQLDMLCNLPHPLEVHMSNCKILLCHGSPWDNNHYIYPDSSLEVFDKCAQQQYDLVVLGHTHYSMCQQIDDTLVVNPGSVGQPRNRQPGAQWALYDTESKVLEFFNESYECSELVEECRVNSPQLPYLAEILTRT